MSKIVLGCNKRNINDKIQILNKIRCKYMDSRQRKKKTKPNATKKDGGILKFLKNIIIPCNKPKNDESHDPEEPAKCKQRKCKIPLAMKQTVWVNQFGEVYKHKCVTKWCHRIITVFDFEVGHNIPESKGGVTSPENLRPICRQCNIGMGNRYTIDEWSKKKFLENK
jgi:5-methylcytosine-specific restriction endonuclease McrA